VEAFFPVFEGGHFQQEDCDEEMGDWGQFHDRHSLAQIPISLKEGFDLSHAQFGISFETLLKKVYL